MGMRYSYLVKLALMCSRRFCGSARAVCAQETVGRRSRTALIRSLAGTGGLRGREIPRADILTTGPPAVKDFLPEYDDRTPPVCTTGAHHDRSVSALLCERDSPPARPPARRAGPGTDRRLPRL